MNSRYLDDVALIKLFIKGGARLAANEKLRVQPAHETDQLLARNGQILAIAQLKANPPEIRVRNQSTYTELLDKALRSQNYLPRHAQNVSGFTRYEYYPGPEGYKLYCEPARLLWRQWWIRYRQSRPQFLDMELLLLTHQQWYPVRNIVFSNSTLFVTTYRGETAHRGEDLVIWAEKETSTAKKGPQSYLGTQRRKRHAPSPASPTTASVSQASGKMPDIPNGMNPCKLPATWSQVVRCEAGKVYIKTALGELMVQGADLHCQFTEADR